jgi:hypothetical protein
MYHDVPVLPKQGIEDHHPNQHGGDIPNGGVDAHFAKTGHRKEDQFPEIQQKLMDGSADTPSL